MLFCMGQRTAFICPYLLNYGREYSQEVQNSNPARVKAREEVQNVSPRG
jgi:hypothetical protein